MPPVAKLLGVAFFGGIAVFGAPPAGAFLITQPQAKFSDNGAPVTLCVDVRGSSTAPGTIIWAFPCNGTAAEQWHFVGAELQGLAPNLCLVTRGGKSVDGTPVVLGSCAGSKGQSWGYDNRQIYLLKAPNRCLDGEAGVVQQLAIHTCSSTAASQQWVLD
jgi:hypothetical protein